MLKMKERGFMPWSSHTSALILASSSLSNQLSFGSLSMDSSAGDKMLRISQLNCTKGLKRPGELKFS